MIKDLYIRKVVKESGRREITTDMIVKGEWLSHVYYEHRPQRVYEKLGLTAQHMVDEALKLLQGRKA